MAAAVELVLPCYAMPVYAAEGIECLSFLAKLNLSVLSKLLTLIIIAYIIIKYQNSRKV
jgi:hypothetical protein